MDKTNKVDFFRQVISFLSKYTTNEIEIGLIAYFLSQLGYACNENTFPLQRDKSQKRIDEVKAVFADHKFPVDIEVLIEFFEYMIEQDEKTEKFLLPSIFQTILRKIYLQISPNGTKI